MEVVDRAEAPEVAAALSNENSGRNSQPSAIEETVESTVVERPDVSESASVEQVASVADSRAIEESVDVEVSSGLQQPAIGAAQEAESGGGSFYMWGIGLLILLRRKAQLGLLSGK